MLAVPECAVAGSRHRRIIIHASPAGTYVWAAEHNQRCCVPATSRIAPPVGQGQGRSHDHVVPLNRQVEEVHERLGGVVVVGGQRRGRDGLRLLVADLRLGLVLLGFRGVGLLERVDELRLIGAHVVGDGLVDPVLARGGVQQIARLGQLAQEQGVLLVQLLHLLLQLAQLLQAPQAAAASALAVAAPPLLTPVARLSVPVLSIAPQHAADIVIAAALFRLYL
mmetsp:Transcript_17655/g.45960  ORF Transcript_17655/g.45960 Transcript_17655/m.45960 type:complete len:223 (+) Transcript_17655:64-732(+)